MEEQKNEEQFWEKERKLRESIADLEEDKKSLQKLCEIIEKQNLSQIKTDYIVEQIKEDEKKIVRLKREREQLLEEYKKHQVKETEQPKEQTSKSCSKER